tara:strand:- start:518 stop:658 length:141 start_codon:yes stop_codon:yes gene_type:complete
MVCVCLRIDRVLEAVPLPVLATVCLRLLPVLAHWLQQDQGAGRGAA